MNDVALLIPTQRLTTAFALLLFVVAGLTGASAL